MQDIIEYTKKLHSSEQIQKKIEGLESISEDRYKELHTSNIVPLNLTIDLYKFEKQITTYDGYFRPWGSSFADQPRYGLPLVNQNGSIDDPNDPTAGSLTEWNSLHPDEMYIETDFQTPTEVLDLECFDPLRYTFDGHWTRSNILKWGAIAEFQPHIDNAVPAYWYRLWGTNKADSFDLSFYDETLNEFEKEENIESGRLYLIDTTKVHIAKGYANFVHQFFLSVKPSAYETLKGLIA